MSRLDDKTTGAIVAVIKRLHIDDLAGHLLQQGWEVLSLSAIAETAATSPSVLAFFHHRKIGELLHPARQPQ